MREGEAQVHSTKQLSSASSLMWLREGQRDRQLKKCTTVKFTPLKREWERGRQLKQCVDQVHSAAVQTEWEWEWQKDRQPKQCTASSSLNFKESERGADSLGNAYATVSGSTRERGVRERLRAALLEQWTRCCCCCRLDIELLQNSEFNCRMPKKRSCLYSCSLSNDDDISALSLSLCSPLCCCCFDSHSIPGFSSTAAICCCVS